jgi:hypothetical protein
LEVTFAAPTNIIRFELYGTDAAGVWNTGQAWATDQFINPVEGPALFNSFPLVLFEGAPQLNAAYAANFSTSFGTFGAGAHTLDMYGQIEKPVIGYFKLLIFVDDPGRTIVERIIADDCVGGAPAPCPSPPMPDVVPGCSQISVSWTVTAGLNYRLYRSDCGGVPPFTVVASGTTTGALQTIVDGETNPDCDYSYYLSVEYPACGFRDSNVTEPVFELQGCFVNISVLPAVINPGDPITVIWSSGNIAAGGACASSDVTISAPIGVKPGNASGSQVINPGPLVDTCYDITGCNICGNCTAQACVTVASSAAFCVPPTSARVRIKGYSDSFFLVPGACCSPCASPAPFPLSFPWNGQFVISGSCSWVVTNQTSTVPLEGGGRAPLRGVGTVFFDTIATFISFFATPTPQYLCRIVTLAVPESSSQILWEGKKFTGNNGLGIYNRTAGCDLRASIEIEPGI